jgi:hypothetical protein
MMEEGCRVEGRGKKGAAMLGSDDSEGSSMDSSDNDFEEQIRKMKVSNKDPLPDDFCMPNDPLPNGRCTFNKENSG